jgi:2-succinyl-6-hydroxy-2,4-cyclohexadiene-1-carboxylate synthase
LTELLDTLGISRAAWVGYSMGGRIALGAAVRHPDRISRLILESASPGLENEPEREARQQSDEALAARIESRGIEEFVDYWTGLPLFATQEALSTAGSQPSLWNDLGRIGAPTLVLAGSEDSKYGRIGARMSKEIPDATLALIPGAGHTTHLEAPGDWLGAVEGFLPY